MRSRDWSSDVCSSDLKPLADAFRAYCQTLDFGHGTNIVYSASTCAPFPDDAEGIRELAARQWEHPVRFTETVQRLYEDGFRVFLEVGPSGNLKIGRASCRERVCQ